MLRPIVIVMFALSAIGLLRSFFQDIRAEGGMRGIVSGFGAARLSPANLLPALLILFLGAMLIETGEWSIYASIIPLIVGSLGLVFATLTLANDVFRRPLAPAVASAAAGGEGAASGNELAAAPGEKASALAQQKIQQKMHMDIRSHVSHLPAATRLARGALFFGWLAAFLAGIATIGLVATVPVFIIAYMRLEGRERWSVTFSMAARHDGVHLRLVRPAARNPLAADTAGNAIAGPEGYSWRLEQRFHESCVGRFTFNPPFPPRLRDGG